MNNYEKLIEFIINEDEKSARELFHRIVVEKSRSIYESLMDDEEEIGGDQVDSLIDEVSADEEGIAEGEDEEYSFGEEDGIESGEAEDGLEDETSEHDFDDSGDLDAHEVEHEDEDTRIRDLEDAFAELQAEFEEILAQQGGEEGDESEDTADGIEGEEDFGSDETSDLDSDEEVTEAEEEGDEYGWDVKEPEEKKQTSRKISGTRYGATGSEEEQDSHDVMREYIEKIGNIYGGKGDAAEGAEVANGKSVAVNKKTVVAGKNDMGGSTANIAKGGSEANPDNKQYSKPTNQYSKGQGTLNTGNINVPGGKAGSAFKEKQTAKVSESKKTKTVKRTAR